MNNTEGKENNDSFKLSPKFALLTVPTMRNHEALQYSNNVMFTVVKTMGRCIKFLFYIACVREFFSHLKQTRVQAK